MTTQTYQFTKEEVQNVENNTLKTIRGIVEHNIYPNLTESQKEFISVEDCVQVYRTFLNTVELNLTVDDLGNIEREYSDLTPLTEITERFVRCIKAIKRGSVYSSWSQAPNFSEDNEENGYATYLKEDFEKRNNVDAIFKEYNLKVRGKNRKSVIVNVVFNLLASCDNRESYLVNRNEDDRIINSIVEVSNLFNNLVK